MLEVQITRLQVFAQISREARHAGLRRVDSDKPEAAHPRGVRTKDIGNDLLRDCARSALQVPVNDYNVRVRGDLRGTFDYLFARSRLVHGAKNTVIAERVSKRLRTESVTGRRVNGVGRSYDCQIGRAHV